MNNQETVGLLELSSEATEALHTLCEQTGVDYDSVKEVMECLYRACVCSIEQLSETFRLFSNTLAESVTPAVQAVQELFRPCCDSLFFMVPPHIKHLAYNHPKARVRNKNWNRMWKIRERYMKCHKT